MAGVAPTLRRQLLEHIESLCEQQHITFLIVEHDMEVVMEISDRVMVMDEGALVADGSPESIQGNERVIEAYLGRFAGDKREDWAEAAHEG
jgi:ABC-type branched-subunit amino acid transport system ATPase component